MLSQVSRALSSRPNEKMHKIQGGFPRTSINDRPPWNHGGGSSLELLGTRTRAESKREKRIANQMDIVDPVTFKLVGVVSINAIIGNDYRGFIVGKDRENRIEHQIDKIVNEKNVLV